MEVLNGKTASAAPGLRAVGTLGCIEIAWPTKVWAKNLRAQRVFSLLRPLTEP